MSVPRLKFHAQAEIDLAVHSLKDLSTQLPDGLVVGAYCNAIGPWITALFIGHRVIQPHTPL